MIFCKIIANWFAMQFKMTTKLGLIIGVVFVLLGACVAVFGEPNTLLNYSKLDIFAAYLREVRGQRNAGDARGKWRASPGAFQ